MAFKDKTKKLIQILSKKDLKLCVAESVTGGRFAYEIIKNKNASKVFDYSLVTYSNSSKSAFLKLKNPLKKYDVISREISELMVKEVIKYSKNKKVLGVSCTGQAGPNFLNKNFKIGTVFIGINYNKKITSIKKSFLNKSRSSIINATVCEMLDQCLKVLSK